MPLPIPRTHDELTGPWLTEALAAAGRLDAETPVGLRTRRIGVERGFTGEVALVQWWPLDGPKDSRRPDVHTLVAKFPAAVEHYERCVREVRFYETIGMRAALPVPTMIYGIGDAATSRVIVLLEPVHGRGGDVVRGCRIDEARSLIDGLARMHATWWQRDELSQYEWLPRWGQGEARAARPHRRRTERFRRRIDPFLDRFAYAIDPPLAHLIRSLADQLEDLLVSVALLPPTLIHADMHLDNVIFVDTHPNRPTANLPDFVLLDWQSVSAGPGLYDVARLLIESLDDPRPTVAVQTLLDHYADRLSEYGTDSGADLGDRSTMRDDFRRLVMCVLAGFVSGYGGRTAGTLVKREITMIELALSQRGIGGIALSIA